MPRRALSAMEQPATVLILGKSLCAAALAEQLRQTATNVNAPLSVTLEPAESPQFEGSPDITIVCASECGGQDDASIFESTIARFPGTRLVAMSPRAHALNLVTAIEAGAKGFIACGIDDVDDVMSALIHVLQNQIAFSTDVSILIVDTLRTAGIGHRGNEEDRPGEEGLTDRERDVLSLLRKGQSNQQIAHELGISANTVKNHLARAYRKLGVNSRAEAISMVVRQHLA